MSGNLSAQLASINQDEIILGSKMILSTSIAMIQSCGAKALTTHASSFTSFKATFQSCSVAVK